MYWSQTSPNARKAAAFWKQSDCPFEQALALFNGSAADKREAISIVHLLNALAFYDKMKQVAIEQEILK